jgi:hypothetical protein
MPILQPHSSWSILDSTKLTSYMECPRSYFYEYILGWRPENPNIHLEFGKAWHLAMEHLILEGYTTKAINEAFQLFLDHYRQFFPEIMDEENAPKNPTNAMNALVVYCREYQGEQYKPLYTEVAGTVPIDDKHILHFRMDSIMEVDGQIRSREHKTGSQLSRQWTDQWSLAIQTFVYNHALCCLFPPDQVWGVEINGTFFYKNKTTPVKFMRVPARRNLNMMQTSYWNILHYIKMLDLDMDILMNDATEDDQVMMCFPLNPTNCTKYFGCRYHDFCMSWPNPLQRCEDVPFGMKVEYWNPAEEESKHKFNLERR